MDCTGLIARSQREGKTTCVPLADWTTRAMQPVRLHSLAPETLTTDRHGVRVPIAIEPVAIEMLELVIVPGLAYDESGGRLGRGGGFYDRFLAQLPASICTIGLAFERQILRQIPIEQHDARVGMIATESRLIRCA
jgi:5-formyltetrahydrofolate cyclo-ligase